MAISIAKADVTSMQVDAIVNSANPALIAGGGVCGAIHRVAKPKLECFCRDIGGCEVGSAVITPAFDLPCRFVIHAVGQRWLDRQRWEPHLLRQCYERIFSLAAAHQLSSLAIPSIGTGIYHYPLEEAEIAIGVGRQFDRDALAILFTCYDEQTLQVYKHSFS